MLPSIDLAETRERSEVQKKKGQSRLLEKSKGLAFIACDVLRGNRNGSLKNHRSYCCFSSVLSLSAWLFKGCLDRNIT